MSIHSVEALINSRLKARVKGYYVKFSQQISCPWNNCRIICLTNSTNPKTDEGEFKKGKDCMQQVCTSNI